MELLSAREVADKLKLTEGALAQMRYLGYGPRFLRIGRRIRYRESDIDDWLEVCIVDDPNSDGQPSKATADTDEELARKDLEN